MFVQIDKNKGTSWHYQCKLCSKTAVKNVILFVFPATSSSSASNDGNATRTTTATLPDDASRSSTTSCTRVPGNGSSFPGHG